MTTISSAGTDAWRRMREFSIASARSPSAGFNRWLVPPAALCIHLCIGMAYGFCVFWLPLSRAIGIDRAEGLPGHVAVAASCSPPPATGRSRASAGCTRCSSCSSASPRRSGAAGSSARVRARPASSRRCAGAAAS